MSVTVPTTPTDDTYQREIVITTTTNTVSVGFQYDQDSDVVVYLNSGLLTLGIHYTVSQTAAQTTVTSIGGLLFLPGDILSLVRDTPTDRQSDFQQGALSVAQLNSDLDRLTLMAQEVKSTSLTKDVEANLYDFQGASLENLPDAVDSQQPVTLAQLNASSGGSSNAQLIVDVAALQAGQVVQDSVAASNSASISTNFNALSGNSFDIITLQVNDASQDALILANTNQTAFVPGILNDVAALQVLTGTYATIESETTLNTNAVALLQQNQTINIANIGQNTALLSSLTLSVQGNEVDISSLQSDVSANISATTSNTSLIFTNEALLAGAISDLAAVSTDVAVLSNQLNDSLTTSLNTWSSQQITTYVAANAGVDPQVALNTTAISLNAANTASITGIVSANSTDIFNNQTAITQLSNETQTNSIVGQDNADDITTIQSSLAVIAGDATTALGNSNNNANDILAANATIAALQAQLSDHIGNLDPSVQHMPFPYYYDVFRVVGEFNVSSNVDVETLTYDFIIPASGQYEIYFGASYTSNSTTQDAIIKVTLPGVGQFNTSTIPVSDQLVRIREEPKDTAGGGGMAGSGTDQAKVMAKIDTIPLPAGAQNINVQTRGSLASDTITIWNQVVTLKRVG